MPFPRALSVSLMLALAACGPPVEAVFEISDEARDAPPPELIATARFTSAQAAAHADIPRIEAETAELDARAQALRARLDGLSTPVLTPDERDRLNETVPPVED